MVCFLFFALFNASKDDKCRHVPKANLLGDPGNLTSCGSLTHSISSGGKRKTDTMVKSVTYANGTITHQVAGEICGVIKFQNFL